MKRSTWNWISWILIGLILIASVVAGALLERARRVHHDAIYGTGHGGTNRGMAYAEALVSLTRWKTVTVISSSVSLAAGMFLLFRGRPITEWMALGLLVVGPLCYGFLMLMAVYYMDSGEEEQRSASIPAEILTMAIIAFPLASGALWCTSKRAWLKALGVLVIVVMVSLAVWMLTHAEV
jgi:hypothetical protein